MSWKFWKSESSADNALKAGQVKLPKPTELPAAIGRDLVVFMKKDPDWVWKLQCVARPRTEEKNILDVRVFSPALVNEYRVAVKDFTSLDAHPELVLFEGWYDKKTMKSQIEERPGPSRTPKPSPLAA